MAVTKTQLAQWSKNFEAQYTDKKDKTNTNTNRQQVTQTQLNQWEQGYQRMQATRAQTAGSAGTSTRQSGTNSTKTGTASTAAGVTGTRSQSGNLANEVLAQMGVTTRSTGTKLQLTVPQTKQAGDTKAQPGLAKTGAGTQTALRGGTKQPEWLTKAQPENRAAEKATAPAARVTGTVQPTQREKTAAIASGSEGLYAQTAQNVKQYTEDLKATDKFSDFDRLNQWMDADPRHRELVSLMRIGTGGQSYAERNNAMQPQSVSGAAASAAAPEKSTGRRDYTDAELLAKGYSSKEISEARQYIADFDALPDWQRAARRASNTIGGIGDTVASSVFLAGESGVQSAKNAAATSANWKGLQESVKSDERQRELLRLMTSGKTQYAAQDHSMQLASASGAMASAPTAASTQSTAYTDAELIAKGYTQQEIDNMRARIAGTEVKDSIDPEKSFGYQLYKRGQDLTAAAQAGLSPIAKQALGIVSSAGENLAVAAIDPAWVLPVLSAQGGAEAMGQSIEKGDSAGKTLAGGLAKFGAGWAINSVGAADLAKTMGADYAKNTLAGKLADAVRSVASDGALAQQYPAVANAISGGVDNAMQAFVETYADKAIDAALGDSEAAESLFTKDTFLTALESGLTGGASGALGGAVGTGLAKANGGDASLVGNVERAAYEQQTQRQADAQAQQVQQFVDEKTADNNKTGLSDNEKARADNTGGVRYSIQVDEDGKNFVQVDSNILDGVAPENQLNVVRDAIRDLFPDGFERDGKHIDNTREGRGEFVRSKYSRTLENANPEVHADKMRMAGNLDEIIQTSSDVQNEKAKHKNAESFNRGKINVRVGTNDYRVDVLTAIKNDGREVFYDVVGIEPEKIKAPTRTAEETSGSKSVETDETFRRSGAGNAESNDKSLPEGSNGDSRRTIAELAEADHRGQPGTPLKSTDATTVQRTGSSADGTPATNVTQQAGEVNGNTAEKGAESSPAEYADVELRADMANLDTDNWTRAEQAETARNLAQHYRMSDAAVQTVADNMPVGVGAEIYAPAAASLYRLGVNGEGESFADALKMTGGGGALSGAVQQVLATGEAGRIALEMAYTQGKGEAEHYRETKAAELGKRPGKEALRPDAGTLYGPDGTVSQSRRAGDALIELTAGANGVAAQRVVKGMANNAKGLIRSAAGVVFYSGEADTATVLHETLHEVNSWDAKGGQELIDAFEHYLVVQNGMDSVQQLVESYLDRYERAGQNLTYNQAMEEITADAMQSIFGDEESFKNFLRQQAAEAKMNAAAQGKTDRVMTKIENLLKKVLSDIKNLLVKQPTNAAAKAARTLTEAQLADLQQIYFNHQADAGENYRAALEANGGANKNAAAISDAAAGEGKYSIDERFEDEIENLSKKTDDYMITVGKTSEVLKSIGVKDQTILWNAGKIKKILTKHSEANYKAGKDKAGRHGGSGGDLGEQDVRAADEAAAGQRPGEGSGTADHCGQLGSAEGHSGRDD